MKRLGRILGTQDVHKLFRVLLEAFVDFLPKLIVRESRLSGCDFRDPEKILKSHDLTDEELDALSIYAGYDLFESQPSPLY